VLRLAALMDGFAVQVALRDPDVPDDRMSELWLESAASEVGVAPRLLLKTKRRTSTLRATSR
jgi:hypothetical protein